MRNKIDYGIDLGTTNSAIARMENGQPIIKKADMMDTVPSCVNFNRKKSILVGLSAFNTMKNDSAVVLKTFEKGKTNTFIEFKRTMGTTTTYESSNMEKNFSSAELSAEVLKKLKSMILDENISSIVITIPAKFDSQQREDTMKAAKLAGFKQVQLLQEPIAAATSYGLGSKSKDGFWMVFDFGGGTFDAALIKAEEGILSVKDTEGNNHLGGKNLDEAIVDQIIIPYLQNKYFINFVLNDTEKKHLLKSALKFHAEIAKNEMSYTIDKYNLLTNLGDLPFEDENGEEPEIDLEITSADLERVLNPLFQQAIDITKDLLKRNHLKGADLDKLILVGGPTHSPILRRMLKEQITENVDTSVDPMTVVAKGAALYAATIDIDTDIQNETRDITKLPLKLKYEATSVETTELINIKVLKNKSTGTFPAELFAEFVRSDGAWSGGKTKIGEKAVLSEVHLIEGRSNSFTINIYDGDENRIECEPNQITILQGIGGLDGMQVLPSHICVGTNFLDEEKDLIFPVKGLEKNNRYPATGVVNNLKTRQAIRPGMAKDIIRIPIYEGDYNAEGSNPELNNLIFEVIITGESLPALLPEGSDVDITIKVDKSGLMKFSAYFPLLDYTEELEIPPRQIEVMKADILVQKISVAKFTAREVKAPDILARLENLEQQLENEKGSDDGRLKILEGLRKELLQLEALERDLKWTQVEKELKDAYFNFEDLIRAIKASGDDLNMDMGKIDAQMNEFKQKTDSIIKEKNKVEAKALAHDLFWTRDALIYESTGGRADIGRIQWHDHNFNNIRWRDSAKARALINTGLQAIAAGETLKLRSLLHEIWELRIEGSDDRTTLGNGGRL